MAGDADNFLEKLRSQRNLIGFDAFIQVPGTLYYIVKVCSWKRLEGDDGSFRHLVFFNHPEPHVQLDTDFEENSSTTHSNKELTILTWCFDDIIRSNA